MKITASADWRDSIPFESPMIVADLAPGGPARCFGCDANAALWPRTELWAVKHKHPNNHAGHVRFYCNEHVPRVAPPASAPPAGSSLSRGARRPAAPREAAPAKRSASSIDTVRAMCPDCFVEVNASGECGICGQLVS